ncbi:MAG TPA: hypothetical protein VNZ64_05665 [Candidatus Acidoferrum sp.]|jgi:hypothetical protein|nr:hypothetical protein [Candidatus Acidoferrum sp.]
MVDSIQIGETLKALLSRGTRNEQLLNFVVLRAISGLRTNTPSNAAFIKEVQKWQAEQSESQRRRDLAGELCDDTENADLRFIRRRPKRSFIYEHTLYWWKSKEILLRRDEERTFHHRVDARFDCEEPEISSDPKNIYLDKLVYDAQHSHFRLEENPKAAKWCKKNVDSRLMLDNILPERMGCFAIPFPKGKAQKLESFGAGNKEWSIPGFPDVSRFKAEARH